MLLVLLLLAIVMPLLYFSSKKHKAECSKAQFFQSVQIFRDYITICLNPDASIVHLEDHVPGMIQKSRRILFPTPRDFIRRMQWWPIVLFVKHQWRTLLIFLGFRYPTFKILLLDGLDSPGKSSLLDVLEGKTLQKTRTSTIVTELRKIIFRDSHSPTIEFTFFDASNQFRRLHFDYFSSVHGVLYMVDASNWSNFPTNRNDLRTLMAEDELRGKPFLVLANKIDVPSASISKDKLRHCLGLDTLNKDICSELFLCSIKHKVGYDDGLHWLRDILISRRRVQK